MNVYKYNTHNDRFCEWSARWRIHDRLKHMISKNIVYRLENWNELNGILGHLCAHIG